MPTAPIKTQTVIIGGGLVGCSAALHLARAGQSVILLERDFVGARASGVNFGGVRQHGRHPSEIPLARRSREIWGRMKNTVGNDCEFAATGHLKLAFDEDGMKELLRWHDVGKEHGITTEILSAEKLRARYPWIGEGAVGASFCAEDGQANPRLAGPAFALAAKAAGADIREKQDVLSIGRMTAGGYEVTTGAGLRVQCETLINAAGAWGSSVAERFGEPVPLTPVAPQMFVSEPAPYFIEPAIGIIGGDVYIRQVPRGSIIFGGGRGEIIRDGLYSTPSAETFTRVVEKAARIIPRIGALPIIRCWTGVEGEMSDGIPVIGESATTPGLFHAFGFSGHGFQMAPAVGAILCDLIVKGDTPTDIAPFSIARFSAVRNAATQKTS